MKIAVVRNGLWRQTFFKVSYFFEIRNTGGTAEQKIHASSLVFSDEGRKRFLFPQKIRNRRTLRILFYFFKKG